MQETQVWSLGQEDPLEKEMATHSSGLENPMDRGAWWATVHGVAKSRTRLSDYTLSVAKLCVTPFRSHGLQHTRVLCSPLSPRVCSNSRLLSQWCYPTISSSVTPFSSALNLSQRQSFPTNPLSTSGGQSIGASASASVLPMSVQGRFPLGLTSWISLQSKRLSRVFSSITTQKHQFFSVQPSLWYNSYIHMMTGKTTALTMLWHMLWHSYDPLIMPLYMMKYFFFFWGRKGM